MTSGILPFVGGKVVKKCGNIPAVRRSDCNMYKGREARTRAHLKRSDSQMREAIQGQVGLSDKRASEAKA